MAGWLRDCLTVAVALGLCSSYYLRTTLHTTWHPAEGRSTAPPVVWPPATELTSESSDGGGSSVASSHAVDGSGVLSSAPNRERRQYPAADRSSAPPAVQLPARHPTSQSSDGGGSSVASSHAAGGSGVLSSAPPRSMRTRQYAAAPAVTRSPRAASPPAVESPSARSPITSASLSAVKLPPTPHVQRVASGGSPGGSPGGSSGPAAHATLAASSVLSVRKESPGPKRMPQQLPRHRIVTALSGSSEVARSVGWKAWRDGTALPRPSRLLAELATSGGARSSSVDGVGSWRRTAGCADAWTMRYPAEELNPSGRSCAWSRLRGSCTSLGFECNATCASCRAGVTDASPRPAAAMAAASAGAGAGAGAGSGSVLLHRTLRLQVTAIRAAADPLAFGVQLAEVRHASTGHRRRASTHTHPHTRIHTRAPRAYTPRGKVRFYEGSRRVRTASARAIEGDGVAGALLPRMG